MAVTRAWARHCSLPGRESTRLLDGMPVGVVNSSASVEVSSAVPQC